MVTRNNYRLFVCTITSAVYARMYMTTDIHKNLIAKLMLNGYRLMYIFSVYKVCECYKWSTDSPDHAIGRKEQ